MVQVSSVMAVGLVEGTSHVHWRLIYKTLMWWICGFIITIHITSALVAQGEPSCHKVLLVLCCTYEALGFSVLYLLLYHTWHTCFETLKTASGRTRYLYMFVQCQYCHQQQSCCVCHCAPHSPTSRNRPATSSYWSFAFSCS